MKHLIIPDVHGRHHWKKIVENTKWDRVVFLGDYFDSYNLPITVQLSNYKEILEFASKNDCIMLMGNHDYHYKSHINLHSMTSGYQKKLHYKIWGDKLEIPSKVAYSYKDILFTHAGVTNYWIDVISDQLKSEPKNIKELEKLVQRAYDEKLPYATNLPGYRRGGHTATGCCIWADEKDLRFDSFDQFNINQIVGHTYGDKHRTVKRGKGKYYLKFIDCPPLKYENYLIVE